MMPIRIPRPIGRLGPLVLAILLAASGASGAPDDSARRYAGRTLVEALQQIQALGVKLIYSSDVVTPWIRITQEPASSDPRAILDELLAPHGLAAREGPGGILFIVRTTDPGRPPGGIEGFVRTRRDHRPVSAARVSVNGTGRFALSARDGSFRIPDVPEGSHDLVVTVPGLRDERFEAVSVQAGRLTPVVLNLVALPTILEQVVVTPDRNRALEDRPGLGAFLEGGDILATPGIGEDLHRAVAWQPGIASGDRSATFNVRGGESNEVLFLLDGQELYDPFHLKDFQRFSGIIDSGYVGNVQLFSGAFPAEYGDRMSGVLDIASSIPPTPGSTLVSSSTVNSRVLTDGRFHEGAGHWLVAARTWYPDAVFRLLDRENEGFRPSYQDLLGKARVHLGGSTSVTAHFLAARDLVDFTDPDGDESVTARSQTRYSWLTLNTLWSPHLYSRTRLSHGRIRSERNGRIEEEGALVAGVGDDRDLNVLELGQDWVFRGSERFLLKWGASAKRLDADYLYAGQTSGDPAPPPAVDLFVSGKQYGGYLATQFRPFSDLEVETGVRWDRQTYTGEQQVSPRAGLVVALGSSRRIRAGWGRYYQSQGVYQLQVEDGVTEFFPAQLAEHWNLGYEQGFGGGITLRADAYLKRMSDLRPRYENLLNPFELLPEFEPDRVRIAPDRAEARGVDVTLSCKDAGPVDWWASYSRSSSRDEIDGRMVPRSWDQPHTARFGLNYRHRETWEAGVGGVYHTGWPTTSIRGEVVQEPDGSTTIEPVLGPRNEDRHPAYHRIDVRVSRHLQLRRGRLSLFAEVTNLYGRENVCCVEDVQFALQPGGGVEVLPEHGPWLERVPSFGITWRFDH
jgi:outer membrane cobalamin receptor